MTARFYTISDAKFFVGTVALLNSLRLTGHDHELVILDRGLTSEQRRSLAAHAEFVEAANEDPYLVKPFPALLDPDGIVVLLDSDMIVTDTLRPVIALAESGKICAFPDHPSDYGRWFAEWQDLFSLGAPLRRQGYLNAGFIAVSTQRWPAFLGRWWDACELIASRRRELGEPQPEALAQFDQDALNALLMSEFPAESVVELPGYEWDLRRVAVEDEQRLRCRAEGRTQPLLHTVLQPKVWQHAAWRRVRSDAYVKLAPRVLFSADVPVRLEPDQVPLWLRPGTAPRLTVRALDAYNRALPVLARGRRAPRRLARDVRRLVRRTSSTVG